jgi:hypothetical protein
MGGMGPHRQQCVFGWICPRYVALGGRGMRPGNQGPMSHVSLSESRGSALWFLHPLSTCP